MPDLPLRARRLARRAAVLIGALAAWKVASAQSTERPPPPEGIAAGPVIFAPSLMAGYAYDSNIFFRSEDSSTPPIADNVLTVEPVLAMRIPFANSEFRFTDTLTWFDYKNTAQTNGKTSNDAAAELDLLFSTFDKLELVAHNIDGLAETIAFDPGGEATYAGNAYKLHSESAGLSRQLDGRRGYKAMLSRNVVAFDPNQNATFFDYSGFDGELAYLQPLSSNTHLSSGYLGTRYDHFNVNVSPYVVARTEAGDSVYLQVDGRLSPREPYSIRVGYERLSFAGPDAEGGDYSGLTLQAVAGFVVGGGTSFTVSATRQPYRSFFAGNNYYVFNAIGFTAQRAFPHGSTFGGTLNLARNTYAAPVPPGFSGEGILRVDNAIVAEAYANLAVRERVAFRMSIRKNAKASNYPGADFDDLVVSGGFVLGWF